LDAEPADNAHLVRCAIYTRQSVARPGDDPALASCAVQREIGERLANARALRRANGLRTSGRRPLGYATDPRTKQLVVVEPAGGHRRALVLPRGGAAPGARAPG